MPEPGSVLIKIKIGDRIPESLSEDGMYELSYSTLAEAGFEDIIMGAVPVASLLPVRTKMSSKHTIRESVRIIMESNICSIAPCSSLPG